jgi:hypothetical protein
MVAKAGTYEVWISATTLSLTRSRWTRTNPGGGQAMNSSLPPKLVKRGEDGPNEGDGDGLSPPVSSEPQLPFRSAPVERRPKRGRLLDSAKEGDIAQKGTVPGSDGRVNKRTRNTSMVLKHLPTMENRSSTFSQAKSKSLNLSHPSSLRNREDLICLVGML